MSLELLEPVGVFPRCTSYNCGSNGVCAKSADIQNEFGVWVYVLVGLSILGGMCATLVGLEMIHGRRRDAEREKRRQYWQEQNELRQHLQRMQERVCRSCLWDSCVGFEDSLKPMHAIPKASDYEEGS